MTLRAACLCGNTVWEAGEAPESASHCHCSRCRKAHGSAYVTAGAVPEASFRFVQGEASATHFGSRSFCSRCGSPLPFDPFQGQRFVPLGPLEGAFDVKPGMHLFVASKAPWFEITDALAQFETYPPEIDAPALPDLERGPAQGVGGSCLCGAVRFEVDAFIEMRFCHCLRCRRARGAAFASNGVGSLAAFRWTSGEDRVRRYKLPEANRFAQAFCGECGGKLPLVRREVGVFVAPLGSLDAAPASRPAEHIFVASKASWHAITDALPQFPEASPP